MSVTRNPIRVGNSARSVSKSKKTEIRRSGANVFADLGLPDAENHLVKAQLVGHMMDIMKERKLTQAKTAKIIGITQPDVSNLIRGRFRGYSIDRLMGFLVTLDQDVQITVRSKPKTRASGRLTVTAV